MIADELSQDDIDALLGGLGGGGGGGAPAATADEPAGGEAPAAEAASGSPAQSVKLPEFEAGAEDDQASQRMEDLLGDVNLRVKIRLGKTVILVEDLLKLKPGRVVQLDSLSGDPVDILVNDRVVGKGEVIVLNEAFCVRVTDIFTVQEKLERQA